MLESYSTQFIFYLLINRKITMSPVVALTWVKGYAATILKAPIFGRDIWAILKWHGLMHCVL